MNDKVSILIPVKNEACFIEECLLSIINQTYDNWEALVVNDHSTDETASIVSRFEIEDNRIQLIANRGEGIIPALQTAYSVAKGTYITRMDGDDKMRKDKLKKLVDALRIYGSKWVGVGGVHYFAEHKLKSGFKNYQKCYYMLTN